RTGHRERLSHDSGQARIWGGVESGCGEGAPGSGGNVVGVRGTNLCSGTNAGFDVGREIASERETGARLGEGEAGSRARHLRARAAGGCPKTPLDSIQNWEQGHRPPEGPARVLRAVMAKNPVAVEEALGSR